MRLRRDALSLALAASMTVLMSACAVQPAQSGETATEAAAPRDCEPQTGTRVPSTCTRPSKVKSNTTASATDTVPTPVTK